MKALWQISVSASAKTEDAISSLLAKILGQAPSVYTDMETGDVTVSVHLEKLPGTRRLVRSSIVDGIRKGLSIGHASVSIKKLPPENWAESWKRHFKPITVGSALLIKPSWSKLKPKRGQALVVLDPGLSFGTGQHATTSFCLKRLVEFRNPSNRQTMLDIGSGSGILAISAAKLGYGPAKAFDFDGHAVRISRENARANDVRVVFQHKDLIKEPMRPDRQHDIVCANLIYDLLISQAKKICKRVKPNGRLVLAGILITQFKLVQKAFEAQGMRLVSTQAEKEWQSGEFEFV